MTTHPPPTLICVFFDADDASAAADADYADNDDAADDVDDDEDADDADFNDAADKEADHVDYADDDDYALLLPHTYACVFATGQGQENNLRTSVTSVTEDIGRKPKENYALKTDG